jgi:peptidoglycan/LPS O-acetylase OafA/YrhL
MIVLLGLICVDTFFTISAFLAFHYANKIYETRGGLSPLDILRMYAYRFLRFVPGTYLVLLFGIYVMPKLHGGVADRNGNPIWFSFEEVLFY